MALTWNWQPVVQGKEVDHAREPLSASRQDTTAIDKNQVCLETDEPNITEEVDKHTTDSNQICGKEPEPVMLQAVVPSDDEAPTLRRMYQVLRLQGNGLGYVSTPQKKWKSSRQMIRT